MPPTPQSASLVQATHVWDVKSHTVPPLQSVIVAHGGKLTGVQPA